MKQKVLVVDDQPDIRLLVRMTLDIGEFDVYEAATGEMAVESAIAVKPRVVLMDIMMPGMDGFEVYRVLRGDSDTRHIPVIACTAYRDPAIDLRVRDEQFDGLVEKPLKLDDLLALIRRQLGLDVDEV